jgi:hypothetical protein
VCWCVKHVCTALAPAPSLSFLAYAFRPPRLGLRTPTPAFSPRLLIISHLSFSFSDSLHPLLFIYFGFHPLLILPGTILPRFIAGKLPRSTHPLTAVAKMSTKQQDMRYVNASDAREFVETVLTGNGVSKNNAVIVAKCLVEADLRGVDTHGMNRIPSYMARIREGVLDARASPSLRQITPAVAQIDGHNGFGFLAASTGMARWHVKLALAWLLSSIQIILACRLGSSNKLLMLA